MPNKVYIQILSKTVASNDPSDKDKKNTSTAEPVMVFPLMEDLQLDISSEISSYSDMIPGADMLGTLMKISTGVSGQVGEGLLNIGNILDAPRWQKTNPIKFNLKLGFYTVSDPLEDVYKPMKKLIGMTILSRKLNSDGSYTYTPPGLSLNSIQKTTGKESKNDKSTIGQNAKLIAIKIPGVFFIPIAMIKQATPTFSKEITESGFPLWGTLELQIEGLYPALEEFFNADQKPEFKSPIEKKPRG